MHLFVEVDYDDRIAFAYRSSREDGSERRWGAFFTSLDGRWQDWLYPHEDEGGEFYVG